MAKKPNPIIECEGRIYNAKYFDGESLWQLRPRRQAIHTYVFPDGVIMGMFQGERGSHPELDFIVRILRPGEEGCSEAPAHTYWVVDLILKSEKYHKEVKEILKYYIKFYGDAKPFDSVEERSGYKLKTIEYITEQYSSIEKDKTLSLEYVATAIELFCLCEKRNEGAYMFRNLLETLCSYIDGNADYMHVMRSAMRIRR